MSTDAIINIPARLNIGEKLHTTLGGEAALLVGTAPDGRPAILTPAAYNALCAWKLPTLRLMKGHVYACGGQSRAIAARVLTDKTYSPATLIKYRNGNPLDLRPSNIVAMSRTTYLNATRHDATVVDAKKRSDGQRLPYNFVSAAEKLRRLMDA